MFNENNFIFFIPAPAKMQDFKWNLNSVKLEQDED